MKVHTGLIAAALGALAVLAAAWPAFADSLRISGTGLVTAALRALAPAFAARIGIFVAIDRVEPSLKAYRHRSYPYGKLLYVVAPAAPSAAARAFVGFLASPETRPQLDELALAVGAR